MSESAETFLARHSSEGMVHGCAHLVHLRHTTLLHPLELSAEASLLNLALLPFLRVLKGFSVTKLNEMTGLAHLTLEPAESTLDRLSITDSDGDFDGQLGGAHRGYQIESFSSSRQAGRHVDSNTIRPTTTHQRVREVMRSETITRC